MRRMLSRGLLPAAQSIVAGVAALGVVAGASGPAGRVHAATPRDAMLISVADLSQLVERRDPTLVVLFVGSPQSYAAAHIPGARLADPKDFTATTDPSGLSLHAELPTDEKLRATLQSLGGTPQTHFVLVGDQKNYSAPTRLYLTLAHAGFGPNTRLLDGSMKAWVAAGRPTTTDVPAAVQPTSLPPLKTVKVTVDAAFVRAHARTPGTVILDVRSPAAWQGIEAATMSGTAPERFGHIPGSHSLPFEDLWDDASGALRPASELEALFSKAGVKPGDTLIGYCYVGLRATATLFAAETLGYKTYLYDGSMEEWAKLGLPLEMPDKRGGSR
jgi:thiosulfate/3-mercaptopyruvate sulfurtransferase